MNIRKLFFCFSFFASLILSDAKVYSRIIKNQNKLLNKFEMIVQTECKTYPDSTSCIIAQERYNTVKMNIQNQNAMYGASILLIIIVWLVFNLIG